MHELFRYLHMPADLACEFLAVFSRLEYALKSTTYATGSEKKVEAAWDRFANDINEKFLAIETQELVEARAYLLGFPPRKQVLQGEKLSFVEQKIDPRQAKTQQVLLMVRTVRNNLFHGGKYAPDGEHEAGRNQLLVTHGLRVLLACSKLNSSVKSSFEN